MKYGWKMVRDKLLIIKKYIWHLRYLRMSIHVVTSQTCLLQFLIKMLESKTISIC